MPNDRLSDRQKRIIRTFSKALRDNPDMIDWFWQTQQSDDNRSDLAVNITTGNPAVDENKEIYKSDLKLFQKKGLLTTISGGKFRVNAPLIHRIARK